MKEAERQFHAREGEYQRLKRKRDHSATPDPELDEQLAEAQARMNEAKQMLRGGV